MKTRAIRHGSAAVALALGGSVLATLCGGCAFVRAGAMLFGEDQTKKMKAEYPQLADQMVCILVRADAETTFEYPHVQWELADHVRVALEQNVQGIKVVDPRRVAEYQRGNPSWEKADPAELGKRFAAQRVLEIDLTEYTTREPDSPHVYRGRIGAVVGVYNAAYPGSEPVYTTELTTVYPPEGVGEVSAGDRAVRRVTMETFAEDLAGKFYDRSVKVK